MIDAIVLNHEPASPTLGLSNGQYLDLVGAGLVLLAIFFHVLSERAPSEEERTENQRKAVASGLLFLFYTYVVVTFAPNADTWVAQIGFEMEAYFRTFARKVVLIGQEGGPVSPSGSLVGALRTLGLAAYVLFFSAASYTAKFPIKVYESLSSGDSGEGSGSS